MENLLKQALTVLPLEMGYRGVPTYGPNAAAAGRVPGVRRLQALVGARRAVVRSVSTCAARK